MRHLAAAAFALALAVNTAANAQSWQGTTSNDWNVATNWLPAAVPAKSTATALTFDAAAASFTPDANESWTLGSMQFLTSGYSVTGLDLSFGGVAALIANPGVVATVSNQLTLLATLTVDSAGTLTLSGPITGAQDIVKSGAGQATFSGAAYPISNTTTVAQGTLTFGNGATGPGAVGAIVNNGVLVFDAPILEVRGPVSGTGSMTIEAGSIVTNRSGAGFAHQGTTTVDGILDGTSFGVSVDNDALLAIGATGNVFAFTGSVGSIAGAGQLNVTANTFFAGSDDTSTTFSGSLVGPGNFTKTGSGTLTFTDPVFDVGIATVEAPGTMRLGDMVTGPSDTNALVANGSLVFAMPFNTDVNGLVTGTGTVTVEAGAFVTNRSGAGFAHQGPTIVHGHFDGTSLGFSVNNSALLTIGPTGEFYAFTGSVGSLDGSGRLEVTFAGNTFFVGSDNTSTTYDGVLEGPGNFTKLGSGTLTFSGGGLWVDGVTTVEAPGTLALGNGVSGPSAVNALVVNGALVFAAPFNNTDVNGPVTGTGTVTVTADTIVTNRSGAGFAHQGPTTVHGLFDGTSFGFSVDNNALLTIGLTGIFFAYTGSVGSLTGTGRLELTNAANSFFVGSDNTSTTFSGLLAGAGTFAKVGTGVLTLAGSSGPGTGPIAVNAGTLRVTGGYFTTGLTVASGATLTGTGSIAGPVTINAGATFAPGPGAANFDTESLALGGNFAVEILGTAPGTQHDRVNVLGTVLLNNPALVLSGAYVPAPGNTFVIVANDGADAVTGTFNGLPEGATLVFNGVTLRISYAGGTGNDIVLSHVAYTVTPSAGANGTINPNTPQSVTHGATTAFTVAPAVGYTASVGGTCGGTLVGNTYTTNAITADCTVAATFSAAAVTTFTGPTATGTGNATASFTGGGPTCTYAVAQLIPVTGHAASPPAGTAPTTVTFPHGLFDFRLTGCTPGSVITMTIAWPATPALIAGTQYWKYGPEPANALPHWYVMPATVGVATTIFTITDGLQGDDDLAANGTIVDQGGPGVPPGGGGVAQTPTLSQWALLLLITLMLGSGAFGGMRQATRSRR